MRQVVTPQCLLKDYDMFMSERYLDNGPDFLMSWYMIYFEKLCLQPCIGDIEAAGYFLMSYSDTFKRLQNAKSSTNPRQP